ncbi:MAG: S9 family peptidase [Chlamydiales bacterium]
MAQTAPYGSWKSPITSQMLVEGALRLGFFDLDGDIPYWTEGRPQEKGRTALMTLRDGESVEVLPQTANVRTTVHEYGGKAFKVHHGVIYYSEFTDQRIYVKHLHKDDVRPITPEGPFRYADFEIDSPGRYLYCVREAHREEKEPLNTIVRIDLQHPSEGEVLFDRADFCSNPRLSRDGKRLAWVAWNHPNMPWDGTELWVADVTDEGLKNPLKIAGGTNESIFQPEWGEDQHLYFVSDRSGWWNLYISNERDISSLFPVNAECGLPHWVFGMCTYAILEKQIVLSVQRASGTELVLIDPQAGTHEILPSKYSSIEGISGQGDIFYFKGGAPDASAAMVQYKLDTKEETAIRQSRSLKVDSVYISQPQSITFPTTDGKVAYAWYYPPQNPDFSVPETEKPPLLVKSHGGPTAHVGNTLNLGIQYWTSRGFAVVDVNYGGSTGFGREYRERLKGNWGIVDVDDCCNAALYLVEKGLADPQRLAIDGGSAGGYTTLAALTFRDVFTAGASYYGVSDLEALARDTHKFESRYLDQIVGPYPEAKELYLARSPIHHTSRLSCPIILLQGLEDKVVPPNQSEKMYEALVAKGIPAAYITFEHEQHGFRMAENIIKAIESEFYFYSRIFDFKPADQLEEVPITCLKH